MGLQDSGRAAVEALVERGHRAGKAMRTEILRARVTPGFKDEVMAEAARDDRSEADMVRILVAEGLASRRALRRG